MAIGDVLGFGVANIGTPNTVEESASYIVDPNLEPIYTPPPEIISQPAPVLTAAQKEFYESDISPFADGRILPPSGEISFFQIREEVASSGQCSFNDEEFRSLIGKADGEEQAISDYYGKSFDLGYGENLEADGGAGAYEPGCTASGSTGRTSRYVRAQCNNNSLDGNRPEVRYWIFVPFAKDFGLEDKVVKLDYEFTHNHNHGFYSDGAISVGAAKKARSPGSFLSPVPIAEEKNIFDFITDLVYLRPGSFANQHIDGSAVSIPEYGSGQKFNASTYFTIQGDRAWLVFQARVAGYNGGGFSEAQVNYKLTDMSDD